MCVPGGHDNQEGFNYSLSRKFKQPCSHINFPFPSLGEGIVKVLNAVPHHYVLGWFVSAFLF